MVFESADVSDSILEDGCIIRGESKISDCIVSDISQVQGDSVVNNSVITGRHCIEGGEFNEKVLHTDTELTVSKGY